MRKLTAREAEGIFDLLVQGLAKQHLRLQFRKRFGSGELLDGAMFIKGTAHAPLEKPVANLLHETPEEFVVTRFAGTGEALVAEAWTTDGTITLRDLISGTEVEQAFVVEGRRARLHAYFDPTDEAMYAARESLPAEAPAPKPKPPRRSRTARNPRAPRRR